MTGLRSKVHILGPDMQKRGGETVGNCRADQARLRSFRLRDPRTAPVYITFYARRLEALFRLEREFGRLASAYHPTDYLAV